MRMVPVLSLASRLSYAVQHPSTKHPGWTASRSQVQRRTHQIGRCGLEQTHVRCMSESQCQSVRGQPDGVIGINCSDEGLAGRCAPTDKVHAAFACSQEEEIKAS